MRYDGYTLGFGLVVIFALHLSNVIIQNQNSNSGPDYETLQLELHQAKLEHMKLEEQYLKDTSYLTLSEKAKKMGFTQPESIIELP